MIKKSRFCCFSGGGRVGLDVGREGGISLISAASVVAVALTTQVANAGGCPRVERSL